MKLFNNPKWSTTVIFMCSIVCLFLYDCTVQKAQKPKRQKTIQAAIRTGTTGNISISDLSELREGQRAYVLIEDASYEGDVPDAPYMVSLPFLGFSRKVKVSAFAIGNMSDSGISFECTPSVDRNNDRARNCLIIAFGTAPDDDDNAENYLAVLDYLHHKSYLMRTDLDFFWSHSPKIYLVDLTGDGQKEIVLSNIPNKGRYVQIFRFSKNNLQSIYQNTDEKNNNFSGRLENEYRAIVYCRQLGFKKRISPLDIGFSADDFEIGKGSKGNPEDDLMQFTRCYRQGKLVESDETDAALWIPSPGTDDSVQFLPDYQMGAQIQLRYPIYLVKYNDIGAAYAYLKYNPETNTMELVGASVDFKRLPL